MKHALVRTSPKGGKFIGVCIQCGKDNLPTSAVGLECPNTFMATEEQSLLYMIKGSNYENLS